MYYKVAIQNGNDKLYKAIVMIMIEIPEKHDSDNGDEEEEEDDDDDDDEDDTRQL